MTAGRAARSGARQGLWGRLPALVLVLAGVAGAPALASTPAELFGAGNSAYEKGRFDEAAAAYETIVGYGVLDPRVLYNLGNTYYKMGRLGPAILQYERAVRLAPGDREARENLEFARGRIRDRVAEPEAPYPVKALQEVLDVVPTDTLSALFLALYLAVGGLVGACLLSRQAMRQRILIYAALAVGLCAAAAGGALAYRIRDTNATEAIVMQDRVDVRSGPAADNTVLFTVHEGTRVEVRNRLEGWYQVSLPNALSGWVPASAVEGV